MTYTVAELAGKIQADLIGPDHLEVDGLDFITAAGPRQITFIGKKSFANLWADSAAGVAVVSNDIELEPGAGRALLRVENADLAMALLLELFAPPPPACEPGIHPAAVVSPDAAIHESVHIGPGCFVGPGVVLEAGVVLYANVSIMADCCIGAGTVFWPGVVMRERCSTGRGCILHPNCIIGADGFGFRASPDGQGMVKIPHIGTVKLGHAVEVGAGSAVDRGKFGATELGDGTKLDNMVQVGHNTKVGRCCVISGQCALAGSVVLGDGVMMGGQTGVADHLTVGDGARIGGGSGVTQNVASGATVAGYPARNFRDTMRIWAAEPSLPELSRALRKSKKK